MSAFTVDRSLLNPKFEGYRLHALSQDLHVLRFQLPSDHRPSQAAVSGRTFLSFQEVQSRIGHNHLAVKDDRAVYVDGQSNVILVELDSSTLHSTLRTVYSLPQSIQTSSSPDEPPREYPSVAFSSTSTCFVSDGHGYLYILQLPQERGTGRVEVLGFYQLEIPDRFQSSIRTSPFKIHSASEVSPNIIVCILSSRYRPVSIENGEAAPSASTLLERRTQAQFDVWAVRFTFPLVPTDTVQPLDIIWHRRGEDVPILTSYDQSRQAFLLLGSSSYRDVPDEKPAETLAEPEAQTDGGAAAPASTDVEMADGDVTDKPKPPPYSWTQTPDTVSLAFPLPTTTPTSSIKVSFSPRSLSVLVLPTSTSTIPFPRYPAKTLWGPINPTQSLWTFDREADRSADGFWGLLTVHLDKKDVGTRWPQVFESGEDVPETMDPSELAGILESLEKFTAETSKDQVQGGLGRGVPSLAKDEYDEEVDDSVGREAVLTWVDTRGSVQGDAEARYGEPEWWARRGKDKEERVSLLSTPLPGSSGELSLVVKEHLDGAVFELPSSPSNDEWAKWRHATTFPALSFVLASKRDTRFTYHTGELVMAFESGSQTFGGNVYLYRAPPKGSKEKESVQSVLKVGGGEAGAVLGVGVLTVGQRMLVCCLCEGEIVILMNVFEL